MKVPFVLVAVLLLPALAAAEPSYPSERVAAVPAGVSIAGKLVAGRRFSDNNGENLLLVSTEVSAKNRDKALHVYHLARREAAPFRSLRQLNDFVKDCEVDSFLELVSGALVITDLDHDGLAEVTLAYRRSCRGDVSPDEMKLMLLENGDKYAMRGAQVLMAKDKRGKLARIEDLNEGAPLAPTIDPTLRRSKAFLPFAQARWDEWKVVVMQLDE